MLCEKHPFKHDNLAYLLKYIVLRLPARIVCIAGVVTPCFKFHCVNVSRDLDSNV